jgi:hypothetical protein
MLSRQAASNSATFQLTIITDKSTVIGGGIVPEFATLSGIDHTSITYFGDYGGRL